VNEPRDAGSVAARLRALRGDLGLSQEQLARRLGVSFATVNRWESGRTQLSARAIRAVAELEAGLGAGAPGEPDRSRAAHAGGNTAPGDTAPGDTAPGDTAPGGAAVGDGPAGDGWLGRLPLAHTSFIGRERELAELARLVGEPGGPRLVSLIGPGGAGKTRLAVEVLSRCEPGSEVVFVPLESVRLPQSLMPVVASRLGVPDQPGVPLAESLRAALTGTARVLVLDGAELVREEAASLVSQLLALTPVLRIIVTSRVLLGVPGEICWPVPPLECPSVAAGAADITASDAVQLFIARAGERLPGFHAADIAPHAVAELCRRLDGLPLAIELIASWVGTLSIQEILQQRAVLLDSGNPAAGQARGRRLADVLQVSHDLLEPGARRLLPMLSVFAGQFGLADAQAVLDVDGPTAAITIRTLVDSSWLVVSRGAEQNLFSMLETIRTFAAAELDKSGDAAAARRRHATHFAALAITSEDGLTGPDAAAWMARLEVAVPDLHLALNWTEEQHELDLGLDAAAALWRWWLIRGRLTLGRGWLTRLLAAVGERRDERTGRALCAAAVLATENGDYRAAIRPAEQALAIFRELGARERTAFAATVLASAHRYLGNNAAARRSFQAAMDLRTALGDRRGVSVAINNMALLELDDGNTERAQELFERALVIKREIGEQRSIAIGLANLADVLIRRGELDAADRVLAEAADLATGMPQIVCTVRCNQGNVAIRREDWAAATEHFEAAIAASQAGGSPHDAVEAIIGLARVLHRTGQTDEAVRQLRAAQTLAADLGSPQRVAAVEAALAEVGGASGASGQAVAGAATGPARGLPRQLTARQAEVLSLLAAGRSNKQIAAELFLSPATVERHLATMYRNLGLTGRVDAARFAIEAGLAPAPESRNADQS
jgi:predicted ATPase/DNA-binding CsgD family transcriptional regulator/DNA-binding XRE family transcriptional regulator